MLHVRDMLRLMNILFGQMCNYLETIIGVLKPYNGCGGQFFQ